jgi:hypothetical protein
MLEFNTNRSLGNLPLVILFGSLAVIYVSEQSWLDVAVWGCLAIAMLLTHGIDLRRPGAWRVPRHLLGLAVAVIAIALILARLVLGLVF